MTTPEPKSILEKRTEKLRVENEKLTALLRNPEYGLFTWKNAVAAVFDRMRAIMDGFTDDE
jgi:hypothetical protein